MAYLDMEKNFFHREDYYMAQIAQEVRRSFVRNPERIRLEPFLIKFERKERPKSTIESSKAFWKALIGVRGKKNARKRS